MSSPSGKIDILLSTYNGERYLRELLESIINQSFTDWRLLIRDDGSRDKTPEILDEYHRRNPDKIILMPQADGNLGAMLSFGKLMEYSTASYVMFCDQDDVWLKDKIQLSFNKLLELEQKFGHERPLLVYTDSMLADQDLNVISNSMLHHMGFDRPKVAQFRNLILCNVAIGNTVIFNRALVKLSCPIPKDATMHDWWVAIVASAFGHVDYVPSPTVFYRQHDDNVCGLRKKWLIGILSKFPSEYKKYYRYQEHVMKQIKAFYGHLGSLSDNKHVSKEVLMLSPLADLNKLGYWKRKSFLFSFYKECTYRFKAIVDLILYFKIYR